MSIKSRLERLEKVAGNKEEEEERIFIVGGIRDGREVILDIMSEEYYRSPENVVIEILEKKREGGQIPEKELREKIAPFTSKMKNLYQEYLKVFAKEPILNNDDFYNRKDRLFKVFLKRTEKENEVNTNNGEEAT